MKKLLTLMGCLMVIACTAQKTYWQQQVNYTIDVSLNDKDKTLDGFEKLSYFNNSPDTLRYIWFHIWPNAYKNDKTAFTEQALENGSTKFYFSSKEEKGYINRLDFKVNAVPAKTEDHPEHIDIIKLLLPNPLPPGEQVIISTPFHVKLPFNFSRGGYAENAFQATQWYPKPAVYDAKGWHEMPYLDQGEFYSEFGNFEVRITLPKTYVVAATGDLQNTDEKNWLIAKSVEAKTEPPKGTLKKKPAPYSKKNNSNKTKLNSTAFEKKETPTELKTLYYIQNNVHDFAWFANKQFIVNYDTCQLSSGKIIDVFTFYTPQQKKTWKHSTSFVKDAVRFYSTEVGEYPYHTISAVQGPQSFGGGMEYPTITAIAPTAYEKDLDIVMAHEVGHNWFYGILASNERQHPWMDEGVNSFYEHKYTEAKYGATDASQSLLLKTKIAQKKDQPIETPAVGFNPLNYALVVYYKTSLWLDLLEKELGDKTFREIMQQYFLDWKFKHPQPEDFKAEFEPFLKQETENYFSFLHTKGSLPEAKNPAFKLLTPFGLKKYFQHPSENILFTTPLVGFNRYDGWMFGAAITNYNLPPSKFQFAIAPLYATKSHQLNSAANFSYHIYPDKHFDQIRLSIGTMNFSRRASMDSNRHNVFERFTRITPAIRFQFKEDARSTTERYIEWKTFLIKEKLFSKYVTKSADGLNYVDSLKKRSRYINQLSFSKDNSRALYPYTYQLQLQQGKDFYRLNLTGNYFFNYAPGGGLSLRLFAAKFGYIGDQTGNYETFYYQPKLLGVTGEEDYTYSNYFIGRTASEGNAENAVVKNKGLAAHQLMIRDGAFKLRFDQYEFLQGRSEKWVTAVNLSTSIPKKVIPIPLKLFLDAGTYAEAWDKNATGSRFLYVGGLQVSLMNNLINIYAPLIYSNEFKEYIQIEKLGFLKRITYSIDLQQLKIKKLLNGSMSL